MARPLRVDVEGGWYHVTARGIERREIFLDDSYRRHFLELLEEMSSRYGVEVHAYCLLDNHWHLIIRTPKANASGAMQWLNVSYSAWFNRKRNRVGHVYQGRFGSVLIDGDGSWLLLASVYLHLNPVRVQKLGLGKRENRAEAKGLREPSKEELQKRLTTLRAFPWSSYRAYAGYGTKPRWLYTQNILRRAGGKEKYLRYTEASVTRGADDKQFESLRGRVAIGSSQFVEKVRGLIKKVTKEQPDRSFAAGTVNFERIVAVVEGVKGEEWEAFRSRHGDDGRDLVLYLARKRSGLTLRQIGEQAGGLEYKTVSKAVQRFEGRLKKDRTLRGMVRRCLGEMSNVET